MENYPYSSSYPDSAESSPLSREIECETATVYDEAPPPPAAARVKLMCSYGGRIQPRPHDNQLSYVGGDTKILAVDRSVRYPSIICRLSALSGSDDVSLKYQLPGEDLDALISVTDDEDLDHMMLEYDRLRRCGSKPVPRLRLFLFAAAVKSLPPPRDEVAPAPARSPIAEKQPQQPQVVSIQRIGSENVPPATAPAAYWPDHNGSVAPAPAASFAHFVGGHGNVYLIPANVGGFPASAAAGHAYYPTVQAAMYPPPPPQAKAPAAYDSAVRGRAVDAGAGYAAPPAAAYDNGAGYAAYDSAGRPMYYAGVGSTYQAVNNVAIAAESKVLKPPQVS